MVIPSSVTYIEENAFAMAGPENLVIPASVARVEEAAFQHMPNLKTVTFEGNTAIEGYAFRGCAQLRTVYLKGDDVTFINSKTGKNSCWFCNGETNNPNVSNITFYVENETVAAKVKACMGAEANNTPVYIGETLFEAVKNATEFQNALNNVAQNTIISFTADISGDVAVVQKANADVVINGNGNKYTGVMTVDGDGRQTGAEKLVIKNVNFVAKAGVESCIYSADRNDRTPAKYSYAHNVTVENCTFTDLDGVVDCAAIRHGDGGDKNWTVVKCTVDNTMHSLLQVNNVAGTLKVENCTINSKNGLNLNQCENVVIINCTANVKGYAVRFGAKSGETVCAETFEITNCTFTSANEEGDAVIMFRYTAVDATLTLTDTTLNGTPDISGNTNETTINKN